jgi:hypothetical protein
MLLGAGVGVVVSAVPAGASGTTVSISPLPSTASFGDFEDENVTISGGDAHGSLSISLFSDPACSGSAFEAGSSGSVGGPDPIAFTGDQFQINDEFAGLGTWSMQAVFTGDVSGVPVASPCEPYTVTAGGSVTGLTAPPWTGSGPLTAEASPNDLGIGGVHTGAIDGSVTFGLYQNAACTVPVPGYSPEVVAPLDFTDPQNPIADTPAGFVPVSAGSYYWQASYSGNTVYSGSMSSCTAALLNFMPPIVVVLPGGGTTPACGPVPSAPTALSTAPGNASATVSWAPSKTGCVAGYVVVPYLGSAAQTPVLIPGRGTTTVVKGLTNGLTYQFAVAGENGAVVGPASAVTKTLTVGAPKAPTMLRVLRVAKGAVKVAFTAPANNGAPITRYTATCTSRNRGATEAKTGKTSPLTVTGLTPNKTYTCTVRATNKRGTGPASLASAVVKA